MREFFIYYRSHVSRAAEVAERVHGFQARLMLEHPGLVARLLRRPEVKDDVLTWMETYSPVTMNPVSPIEAPLQQQIESHAQCLLGLIEGERHCEVFVPCAW